MKCVWEHNGNDTLLYSVDYVGAYSRGETLEAATQKMEVEIASYSRWRNFAIPQEAPVEILQEKNSTLAIADADSDVLFDSEKAPLSPEEYRQLKELALKSARDFYHLYISVPDKRKSCLHPRQTFYGSVPRTAQEMYEHTKNVNAYYFGEIGIETDNEGTIFDCREKGFSLLEESPNFLENPVTEGSYGELWSLRKMLRRFIWHDRIHAKAMYRMATKTFGVFSTVNPFCFPADLSITKEDSP